MSTDDLEKERTSTAVGVVPHPARTPRWPFVATAIVLAALLASSVLMLTQSGGPEGLPNTTDVAAGSMPFHQHTTLEDLAGTQDAKLDTSILEGVEVDVSSRFVEPRRAPEEIARIALDAIAEYEDQVGRELAPARLVSITLVAPGVVYELWGSGGISEQTLMWGVRFEGTIAMWGGSDSPAWFGYPRGNFFISDARGEILGEAIHGPGCFASSENGERPPGFRDSPAC